MSFLERLCSTLNAGEIDYALVGGQAVALYGAVRGTIDIDFVVKWERETLLKVEKCMRDMHLVSRLPVSAEDVFRNRDDYVSNRNLIAWNFYNPSKMIEQVDIIVDYHFLPEFKTLIDLNSVQVPVLKLDKLIEMKRTAGRAQDIEDIKALEKLK